MKSRISMQKAERIKFIIKWLLYVVIVVLSFLYMSMPTVSVKPLILIPVAICIAMNEGIGVSCTMGVICGFLTDVACGKALGFNALIMLSICLFVSLLFMYLMRKNIINIWGITTVAIIIQAGLDLFFFYGIWGTHNVKAIFMDFFFPQMIINLLLSPLIYLLFKAVYNKFGPSTKRFIEEKNENITRE